MEVEEVEEVEEVPQWVAGWSGEGWEAGRGRGIYFELDEEEGVDEDEEFECRRSETVVMVYVFGRRDSIREDKRLI